MKKGVFWAVWMIVVVILAMTFCSAAYAAKPSPEVLYYVNEWGTAVEKLLPDGSTEMVFPLDWNQGDVSVAKNGNRIAFWSYTYDPNTGIISWPISIVNPDISQVYATEISGVPTLSPDGSKMAVTEYISITVVIGGVEWPMGVNQVSIWDIKNPANPIKLYTIPTLSTEENIQEPSWGPDGCLYCSVSDFYISDASPDFYSGIVKYDPKKNKRSWILKQAYAYFFRPEISWDGKYLAYGHYNLFGQEPWSSIWIMSLKGKPSNRQICDGYDFAFGNGSNIYATRIIYYDPGYWDTYIVQVDIKTGQESEPIAWGSNPQLAVK